MSIEYPNRCPICGQLDQVKVDKYKLRFALYAWTLGGSSFILSVLISSFLVLAIWDRGLIILVMSILGFLVPNIVAYIIWLAFHPRRVAQLQQAMRIDKKHLIPAREADRATYEQSLQVWHQLYYCSRDDIIFNPNTGETAPSDMMHKLLR